MYRAKRPKSKPCTQSPAIAEQIFINVNVRGHFTHSTNMEISKPKSFFRDIKSREINGFRVRKRPYLGSSDLQDLESMGAVAVEHLGEPSPPMALSFCKTSRNAHILALTNEREKAKVCEWVAHDNAIFDICWIKEDTNILTASGDQSIKVWDAQNKECIRALMGHTGSVKSISSHPTNPDIVVSGSRDGSFALWDIRSSMNTHQTFCIRPTSVVHEAHTSPGRRRRRPTKAESMSITSVLFLKDEVSVATAGAVDRHLKAPINHACPNPESSSGRKRLSNGISSLSQDLNGVFITASCMDHRIYLYNVLQLEKGPIRTFSGGRIESFFVKAAISPNAAHILSGSSDGNAYIWQVNDPHLDPIILEGHDGEVTAVDWCPSEMGKVATCSDDFTVRFWNIPSSCYSNTRSPSSSRKRILAFPSMKQRKLFVDSPSCTKYDRGGIHLDERHHVNSPTGSLILPDVCTPKSQKKPFSLSFEVKENLEKTLEMDTSSPSSVLNPPSSLKRTTIRDYFSVS
ncbi:denticleless proteinA-like [Dorcoceras hygrometricum]|uniref:Denticleless proteinA-like n=1 Tax=Dorcoceras hygrometricum TaxID=472368 RepID=A0A2Z7CFH6_9LAMI|nr:denticleless proteinA-like [Dorcoceras hygrometricum]